MAFIEHIATHYKADYISFFLQILKELKPLVWIFLSQNVPEVAYLIYLLYMVSIKLTRSTVGSKAGGLLSTPGSLAQNTVPPS